MKKLLIGLSFLTLTFNVFALTPSKVYSNSVTAVLYLEYPVSKEWVKSGTGFFIGNQGIVLTNSHVIAQANKRILRGRSFNGEEYSDFDLLYNDPIADIAVLKVSKIKGKDTYLELASSEEKYSVGDEINWIGHPAGGQEFSLGNGYISKIYNEGNVEKIQFNGVAYKGNSGSAIINANGQVIGILHSITNDTLDIVKGVVMGSGRDNIQEALQIAMSRSPEIPHNEISINDSGSNSSKNSESIKITESKNDLASLIRELKAYTPPEERRLGSL